ncbi:winged helix-turn-helix domain-containing protein [Dactylosporangium sp. NPDC000555]|uniref:winged helix-turn-helix domain-containing protein n=1 Tax=Dactylosporangium sp. NPDC000555 TaxID=3154260 RepID=UPI0033195F8C
MIDPEGPDPLYMQLVAVLRERIEKGVYPPNRPVPSITSLQQEFGLARGTIIHAIEVLREEGTVRTVQGRGTFVAPKEA